MTYTFTQLNRHRQQGAFAIMTAFTLLVLVIFLVLVLDSGRLYMEQRKLQKIADTAALGALLLLPDGNCSTDQQLTLDNAIDNAQKNGFTRNNKRKLTHQCVDVKQHDGLRIAETNLASGRAVEVTVTHEVPSSLILQIGSVFNSDLPEEVILQATAVAARDEPVAVFSVASQLLKLNDNKLLGRLLETVGLDPSLLTLLDQHGVANVSVTPSGLLAALGVGVGVDLKALTPDGVANALIDTDLLGLSLADAAIKAIEESAVAVNPELLGTLKLLGDEPLLGDLDLKLLLFGTPDSRGILSLITANENDPVGAALDAAINLGDLLSTAILVGAKEQGRALSIGSPHDKEDSALQLLRTVTVELGIVEPPSIGIGPVGTTAYNAQIRLKVEVDTDDNLLLSGLLGLLNTRIHLPIIIDLANASGSLSSLSCDGPPPNSTLNGPGAVVNVNSALGAVCIGHMPDTMWSSDQSCNDTVQPQPLIEVLGLLNISGKVNLRVLETYTEPLEFSMDELQKFKKANPMQAYALSTERDNPLQLGTLLKDLVQEVLNLLGNSDEVQKTLTESQATTIADQYLQLPELQPKNRDYYTSAELNTISERLRGDRVDWERPVFIFTGKMVNQWRNGLTSCSNLFQGKHEIECVRTRLISALQTDAQPGLLKDIINTILGDVVLPVLAPILNPLLELLASLLNLVGEYVLSTFLDDLLGLELTRTEVILHDIACGAPRLVR